MDVYNPHWTTNYFLADGNVNCCCINYSVESPVFALEFNNSVVSYLLLETLNLRSILVTKNGKLEND